MKNHPRILAVTVLCLNLASARAQFGSAPGGPDLGGPMGKLFGNNQAFTAAMVFQTTDSSSNTTTMPGKISFDAGKSRFEINMTDVQSRLIPPGASAQMKSMGLDRMVMVTRPDKKIAYLVYPGMQSYVQTALTDAESNATNGDYRMETTELGRETVDGHPCVKNRVTITARDGGKQESTVWNAKDLKNFPVKIQTTDAGATTTTMLFKNVALARPGASLFEAPSGYAKYDDVQTMVQQQLMKRMGGGLPGGFAPPPAK